MAKETPPKPYEMQLDRPTLRALLRTLERSGVTEFEYEDERIRFRIGRGSPGSGASVTHAYAPAPVSEPPATRTSGGRGEEGEFAYVTSPFVGTFYRSASPEAPVFADVNMPIKPGQTLCIVEAMKLMNEIEADIAGTIVEILVENGKSVEFGQKLFKVRI